MKEIFDGAVFSKIILSADAALKKNKQYVNDLNVFPVPDGDTGTNMSLTMAAAANELRKKSAATIGEAAERTASALLRGARGNSGVIMSLLFRGIAKKLKGHETADAKLFAEAMTEGVEAAYKAVMKPTEGTILTVSRVATSAALEYSENGDNIYEMMCCALESGKEALADTINLNPVLKRAGVIDAGGQGYLYILEAAVAMIMEEDVWTFEETEEVVEKVNAFAEFNTDEITFTYCTEFIVSRESPKSAMELREFVESMGDSAVVVDDDEIIKVHVHTNDPGIVLTEALSFGALLTVKIENMREQHSHVIADVPVKAPAEPDFVEATKDYGIVTVCAGAGMSELFREIGADRIVTGGQTMNPSTEDILKEINRTPAETVFVFPNNKNIIMAAEQCVPLTSKKVVVVPTKTMPQGVSAVLCMDEHCEVEELVEAMNDAMSLVHTASITFAARDSDFDGHDIKAGEFLALLDGALVGSYAETAAMFESVASSLEELQPCMISIYYGEDVSEETATETMSFFEEKFPDAEFALINGGQGVYYYLISAE